MARFAPKIPVRLAILRPVCGLALGLAAVLHAPGAWAQSDEDLARARQLYSQGLTQEAAGDWAGALASFQQVSRIKTSPQVRFHIARCKEHLGRLNEALGGYRMAAYEAEKAEGDQSELLQEIAKAREALEARVPKLTIERGEGAGALRIQLDGVQLGQAQIGTPINVDPGPHVITGVLPGDKSFERTIELAEGQSESIVLDVPEQLRAAAPPTARPAPSPAPAPGVDRQEPQASSAAPWVIGGISLASLAASGVFYLLKSDAEKELESGCLGRTCPDTLEDTQKRGETYATLSGVTLGIGLVGVGVAGVMLLSSGPSSVPAASSARLSVRVGPGSVAVGGKF